MGEVSLEEINFSPASTGGGRGANYGWPCREGLSAGPGGCGGSFVNPVFDYPHAGSGGAVAHGCAIIAGYVYRGSQAPEISGRYLYADLCTAQLRSIKLGLPLASGDRAESAVGALVSARAFGEDSACNLYVMNTSTVFRIVGSASSAKPACATAPTEVQVPGWEEGQEMQEAQAQEARRGVEEKEAQAQEVPEEEEGQEEATPLI